MLDRYDFWLRQQRHAVELQRVVAGGGGAGGRSGFNSLS